MRRFPLFDTFRAFAAVAVLLDHWGGHAGIAVPSRLGDYGVTVFFLISGFLLYRPFLTGTVRTAEFYWRRVLRIVPAYWVALTVLSAIPATGSHVDSGDQWLYYFFGQSYTACPTCHGVGQAWTLCCEATFYLLLPLFAALTARLGTWGRAAVILALGSFVLLRLPNPGVIALDRTMLGNLDWFAWGMVIALLSAKWTHGPQWLATAAWPAAGVIFALAVALPAWGHVLYGVSAACMVLPGAFAGGWSSGWFTGRAVAFTGRISYGIYLWHIGLLAICVQVAADLGVLTDSLAYLGIVSLAIPLSFLAGWLSFRFVEAPLMNRRVRFRRAAYATR